MKNIKEDERLMPLNHSCAHLLAQAVKHLYPEAKFWVGPVIEDGFYYDMDLATILEINIEEEQQAIYNYQMVLNVIEDIYVKEIIKRILKDEYLHLEIFQKLKENI